MWFTVYKILPGMAHSPAMLSGTGAAPSHGPAHTGLRGTVKQLLSGTGLEYRKMQKWDPVILHHAAYLFLECQGTKPQTH